MNSREQATFILFGLLIVWMLAMRSTRRSLVDILKLFVDWKIAGPFVALIVNVVIAVRLAHSVGLWSSHLIGTTVLWFVFVGFVWLMNLSEAGKRPDFIRGRLLEAIGVGAFIEAFVNLRTFSLPIELVLQLAIVFLVLMQVGAGAKDELKLVGRFFGFLLAMVGLALTVYTAVSLARNWGSIDESEIRNEFLLPIWLTVSVVPFIFILALFSVWELLAIRLRFANDRHRAPARILLGAISELRWSLREAQSFGVPYTNQAIDASSFRGARRVVRRFRQDRESSEHARAEARTRLDRNAGLEGVDPDGLLLDRRGFAEAKESLEWLLTMQESWYTRDDRSDGYRADLLDMLTTSGLVTQADAFPITMKVRSDRRAWYAFRGTEAGYVFGVGAAAAPPSQWVYDSCEPPRTYPPGKGWARPDDEPIEWREEPET